MRKHTKPLLRQDVFAVVLTGGIAAGKTAVSDRFAELGAPVIDTDLIARELVEPGQAALNKIYEAFGEDYLDKSGGLDRRKMRQAIFADATLRTRLEAILHPLIIGEVLKRLAEVDYPYCLIVVPLYFESERWSWVDRVVVVDVARSIQIERLITRDRTSAREAELILASQAGRTERLAMANDIIENFGNLENLDLQVEALHRKYLKLAREHRLKGRAT